MGGIKKGAKKVWNKLEGGSKQMLDTITLGATKDVDRPGAQPVIPMPDEEVLEQERRRRDARKLSSGRQSTILSDGLG